MSASRTGVRRTAPDTPERSLPSRHHRSLAKRAGALALVLSALSLPVAPFASAAEEASSTSMSTTPMQPANEVTTEAPETSDLETSKCVVPGEEYFFFTKFLWLKWWFDHPYEMPCLGNRPNPEPTDDPSEEPTDDPSEEPTDEPSEEPTDEPSEEPSGEPTEEPSEDPSPTTDPTDESSEEPAPEEPTDEPATDPTDDASPDPTATTEPEPIPTPSPETSEPKPVPNIGEKDPQIPTAAPAGVAAPEKRLETPDPEVEPEAQSEPTTDPSRETQPSLHSRPDPEPETAPEPQDGPLTPSPSPAPEPLSTPENSAAGIPTLTVPPEEESADAPPGVRLNPTAAPTDGSTPPANHILGDEDEEQVDTILSVWTNPDGSALGTLKSILAGTVAVGVAVAGGLGALTLRARAKKP